MSANALESIRNKNGQVRRKPIRDALDAILARSSEDDLSDKPKTIAQEIALSLVRDARAEKVGARSELIDRTEGKAAQALEHSGPDGAAIEHRMAPDLSKLTNAQLAELEIISLATGSEGDQGGEGQT